MIDLNNLIDLLPYYYKDNDSYKDANGIGLLDSYLNPLVAPFASTLHKYLKTFQEDLYH